MTTNKTFPAFPVAREQHDTDSILATALESAQIKIQQLEADKKRLERMVEDGVELRRELDETLTELGAVIVNLPPNEGKRTMKPSEAVRLLREERDLARREKATYNLVPVRIAWEVGYDEEVAFCNPVQAMRLKKWLTRYFKMCTEKVRYSRVHPPMVLVDLEPKS